MKFLLLKTLLLRRAKDQGFTLPVVIAIGLVMILLSTVNMIQSGEETLLSVSKKGSSNALASAEFGIARYRELLNNNRVLAVYNLDQWTTVAGQACNDISDSAGGWADNTPNNWKSVTALDENTLSVDLNNDGDTNDSESIGQYQIVNYIYDNDNDITTDNNGDIDLISDVVNNDGSPPRGLLTVQGRSTDGSEAQIQVEIPLGINTDDLDSLDPALWIERSSVTNIGNVNVNGSNIVLYRPAGSGGCDDPPDLSSPAQNTISDPRLLPDIVDITAITNVRTIQGDINTETDPVTTDPDPNDDEDYPRDNYFQNGEIILGTGYDDSGATQALNTLDERYYYTTQTASLVIDNGESILADGTSKVILYVGGNLDINTGANLIRLGNSSNIATSRYLEIHVNGNVTIDGDGDLEITGLLHVPNGTVTISGSASVNVTGSIWANNWDNTSGTVTIDTDDYKFYSITPDRTPKPLTYRPRNWETQEVQ